jgi:hypothetical protein
MDNRDGSDRLSTHDLEGAALQKRDLSRWPIGTIEGEKPCLRTVRRPKRRAP